jgi:OmpA family
LATEETPKVYVLSNRQTLLVAVVILAGIVFYFVHQRGADSPSPVFDHAAPGRVVLAPLDFETDSAALTPQDRSTLQQAAALMSQNDHKTDRLCVKGYAGDGAAAQPLFHERAINAAAALEDLGIARDRLTAGKGCLSFAETGHRDSRQLRLAILPPADADADVDVKAPEKDEERDKDPAKAVHERAPAMEPHVGPH